MHCEDNYGPDGENEDADEGYPSRVGAAELGWGGDVPGGQADCPGVSGAARVRLSYLNIVVRATAGPTARARFAKLWASCNTVKLVIMKLKLGIYETSVWTFLM